MICKTCNEFYTEDEYRVLPSDYDGQCPECYYFRNRNKKDEAASATSNVNFSSIPCITEDLLNKTAVEEPVRNPTARTRRRSKKETTPVVDEEDTSFLTENTEVSEDSSDNDD